MNIPSIIQQQLFQSGKTYIWSWGAHGWTSTIANTLTFKVDAWHFKGIISIQLDEGQDLYNIHFFDNYTLSSFINNPKPSKKIPSMIGVYCDHMLKLIDDAIERIDIYRK
jgi:hypothetical protein